MNSLRQRKGFETRAYTLDPETGFIDVELKTIKKNFRYKIHLSEVGNEIQYHVTYDYTEKIFYGISALIAIYCTGYYFFGNPENPGGYSFNAVAWAIVALSGIFKTSKDDLHIINGNKIVSLFRNKPNEEQALQFANYLIRKANEKKKEILISFENTEDQFFANVQWLYSMRMIDKMEVEELHRNYRLKKLI